MSGASASGAGFVALLAAGLVLEVAARCGRGPATAAEAVGAAMRTTAGRAAVLLIWVWLGVHFLAR